MSKIGIVAFGQSLCAPGAFGVTPLTAVAGATEWYDAVGEERTLKEGWGLASGNGYETQNSWVVGFANTYIGLSGDEIVLSGYAKGGVGLHYDQGAGKFNDRNAASPADVTTIYGVVLRAVNNLAALNCDKIYALKYQTTTDAWAGVSKANYKNTLLSIFGNLKSDSGVAGLELVIILGGKDTVTDADYDAGYKNVLTADMENAAEQSDIHIIATTHDFDPAADTVHPDAVQRQTIVGPRAGRGLYRLRQGLRPDPGKITSVAVNGLRQIKLDIEYPAGLTLQGTNSTAFEVGKNGEALEIDSQTLNSSLAYVTTKQDIYGAENTIDFSYCSGANPNTETVITNSDGDPILPVQEAVSLAGYSGGKNMLGVVDTTDMDFWLAPASYGNGNGSAAITSGNFPSYPLGAKQPMAFANCAVGEGYQPAENGNSKFVFTAANASHLKTDHYLSISSTTNITFVWKGRVGTSTGLMPFGSQTTTQTYWQVYGRPHIANRDILFTFLVGGTVYRALTGVVFDGAVGDHTIICVVANGVMSIWYDGVDVTSTPDTIEETHVYTTPTYLSTDRVTSSYDGNIYQAWIANRAYTESEIQAISAADNDLGLYGYATGDVMRLSLPSSRRKFTSLKSLNNLTFRR